MITFDFLEDVRLGNIWLPKATDCRGYTCVTPPTKAMLAEYNSEALRDMISQPENQKRPRAWKDSVRSLANKLLIHLPDKHFQMMLLKHVCPEHEIFGKNYVRPRIKKR